MVLSWFRKVIAPVRRPKAAASQRPRYQKCFLELLEDRTLLSSFQYIFTVDKGGDAGVSDQVMTTQNGTTADFGGDIRYVLSETNTSFFAGSLIQFNLKGIGSGSITLNAGDGAGHGTGQGELQISQNTTIDNSANGGASSLTIGGQSSFGSSRIFDVTSQNAVVSIIGLTITNGNARPAPNDVGTFGGDILNSGNLTLTADVVSNGRAGNGPTSSGLDPIGQGGGIYQFRRYGRHVDLGRH